jgi:hypothetical protein
MDSVHSLTGVCGYACHHTVSDGSWPAIVGREDAKHWLIEAGRPTIATVTEVHQSLYAHFREQSIVERFGTFKIVSAECYVANHTYLLESVGTTLDART